MIDLDTSKTGVPSAVKDGTTKVAVVPTVLADEPISPGEAPGCKTVLVGNCTAHSGMVMIVDPKHVIDADEPDFYYQRLRARVRKSQSPNVVDFMYGVVSKACPLDDDDDDGYPVYARVDADGRVLSLTIDFDPVSPSVAYGDPDELDGDGDMEEAAEREENDALAERATDKDTS